MPDRLRPERQIRMAPARSPGAKPIRMRTAAALRGCLHPTTFPPLAERSETRRHPGWRSGRSLRRRTSGGGRLTYKAYSQYPFLLENSMPKRFVSETVIAAPRAGAVSLQLGDPLLIYSRFDLNRMLLERAERAGAQIEKTRVLEITRQGSGWAVRTKNGVAHADFCIVATGARNPLRDVGTEFRAADTMSALGYYVPGEQAQIDIQFLPQLEGYIWIFPRCGHLSVGICGKGEPAGSLRQRLERYMTERQLAWKHGSFYSHMLPSLDTSSWRKNRVAGEGWMAVGDAAGLVDPITGEGLYYALRSADLAVRALLSEVTSLAEKMNQYRRLL